MKSLSSDRQQAADLERAKFHRSVLGELEKKYGELENLVDETLDSIRIRIIDEVKEHEELSKDTLKDLKRATAILDTAGSVIGNKILIKYLNQLEDALHPMWPENFLDEILIDKRFQDYKKVVHIAIGMDKQKWDFIIQEGAKSSFYSRIEDKLENLDKLFQTYKKMKSKSKEEG